MAAIVGASWGINGLFGVLRDTRELPEERRDEEFSEQLLGCVTAAAKQQNLFLEYYSGYLSEAAATMN